MKLDGREREEFALRYLPLVKYVVSRFYIKETSSITREDLFHWGIIGLMEAIDRFDENKGVKFETYAIRRIEGAIKDALRREDIFTRGQREKYKRLMNIIDTLEEEEIDEKTIADKLGMDLNSYQEFLEEINPIVISSVEELLEERGLEISDERESIEDQVVNEELLENLKRAIKRLSDREKQILSLYYYEGLTLKQIGLVLGITESRVSQLHTQIILKLRRMVRSEWEQA
ncbi:FliA/WhiG family RNA polymerase sigma factor [bacterium]|nr:FliA/WhiG family RNA polymerase sigma factor [bacterium]